jgi:FHA domain
MPKEVQPSVIYHVLGRPVVSAAPAGKDVVATDPLAESHACPNCGLVCRPGELVCLRCGVVFTNRLKTKLREDPIIEPPTCANCGQVYHFGEPVCRICGSVLSDFKPHRQDDTSELATGLASGSDPSKAASAVGAAQFVQTPIFLEIDGIQLMLPPVEVIIVGRFSGTASDLQPDIDLNSFGAHEKGVSRRHVRIKRKGTLVLVTDIGSANGTWLNGQRLLVNGERLLRQGDELQLSHLKLRVKYSPLHA